MSDSIVLIETRDTYTKILIDKIYNHIIEGICSIYRFAEKYSKDSKKENMLLVNFQELLRQVPDWPEETITKEAQSICRNCKGKFLDEVISMIFVAHTKILSFVRIEEDGDLDVTLKIPSLDVFIHNIYKHSAEYFFKDPKLIVYLHYPEMVQINPYFQVKNIIIDSINEVIREMLPVKEIMQQYLSKKRNIEKTVEEENEEEEETDEEEKKSKKKINHKHKKGGTNNKENDSDDEEDESDEEESDEEESDEEESDEEKKEVEQKEEQKEEKEQKEEQKEEQFEQKKEQKKEQTTGGSSFVSDINNSNTSTDNSIQSIASEMNYPNNDSQINKNNSTTSSNDLMNTVPYIKTNQYDQKIASNAASIISDIDNQTDNNKFKTSTDLLNALTIKASVKSLPCDKESSDNYLVQPSITSFTPINTSSNSNNSNNSNSNSVNWLEKLGGKSPVKNFSFSNDHSSQPKSAIIEDSLLGSRFREKTKDESLFF